MRIRKCTIYEKQRKREGIKEDNEHGKSPRGSADMREGGRRQRKSVSKGGKRKGIVVGREGGYEFIERETRRLDR